MFSDFLGYSEDAGRIQEKLKQLCFGCEGNGKLQTPFSSYLSESSCFYFFQSSGIKKKASSIFRFFVFCIF